MSEYTVLWAVSRSLKVLLETSISSEPQLRDVKVDLRSPKEMKEDDAKGVSLWLYRVNRNGDRLNAPPRRHAPDQLQTPPLPVDLYYLVTPVTADPEARQALLGRVLQVFHDHATLRGSDFKDALQGSGEELHVHLEALSMEELTRVWQALQEPYQISVTYLVQVVTIDSDLEPIQASPVVGKESRYAKVESVN